VFERLRQEVEAGFPSMAGARLTGSLPINQALVNELLRQVPSLPPGLVLDIHAANRIVARYGLVQATARLDDEVQVSAEGPRIGLELASSVVAFALGRVLRDPAVRIAGRRVTIDLGAVPALEAYRRCWPFLRAARVRTTPGQLQLDVDLAVT
jgi:hypothetical protein